MRKSFGLPDLMSVPAPDACSVGSWSVCAGDASDMLECGGDDGGDDVWINCKCAQWLERGVCAVCAADASRWRKGYIGHLWGL